jgi:hypothetical protein
VPAAPIAAPLADQRRSGIIKGLSIGHDNSLLQPAAAWRHFLYGWLIDHRHVG